MPRKHAPKRGTSSPSMATEICASTVNQEEETSPFAVAPLQLVPYGDLIPVPEDAFLMNVDIPVKNSTH